MLGGKRMSGFAGDSQLHRSHRDAEPALCSIWDFPGLNEYTIYASAFYVHKTESIHSSPLPPPFDSHPEVEEMNRYSLDRTALPRPKALMKQWNMFATLAEEFIQVQEIR